MSAWTNFYRLNKLSIVFANNSSASKATIYGNGKNQAKVTITVEAVDRNGKILPLTSNDLRSCLYLTNYNTGNSLSNPWSSSTYSSGYDNTLGYSSFVYETPDYEPELPRYVTKFDLYISASSIADGVDVAVGINIPGVGKFDTTSDGTRTLNGPGGNSGSVFKSPQKVNVNAIKKIDYSHLENIKIDGRPESFDDFTNPINDMDVGYWTSRGYSHYSFEGKSSHASFTISPVKENHLFKSITCNSSNKGTGDYSYPAYPAKAVWVKTSKTIDFTFIFVQQSSYGLWANNVLKCHRDQSQNHDRYAYKIGSDDGRHSFHKALPSGKVRVDLCNHRIPWESTYNTQTDSLNNKISINVTDNYGNSGMISLHTDNSRWPYVLVNK